ncbi:hypothetical protein K469DRAFT_589451, partial [Zopfia rhizophila CBS 207.26]
MQKTVTVEEQKRVIAEDRKIFEDRSVNFRGTIRVRLEYLEFTYPNIRSEDESQRVRDDLAFKFQEGGCYRLIPSHYIPAIVDRNTLSLILGSLSQSAEELVENAGKMPPEPKLPRDFRLECLQGRSRVKACEMSFPVAERWWTVNLYLSEAGTELRTALIEEYSGSSRHSDSEIYKMITYYRQQGTGRNKFAEKRWWLRLSPNKMRDLKLFLNHGDTKKFGGKRNLTNALNALLTIPNLWNGNWIGILHHALALKCDERLVHYLEYIYTTWTTITGESTETIDGETIAELELRAPSVPRDRAYLEALFEDGVLFKYFQHPESRESIWRRLVTFQGIIPTLRTFFQDIKFLSPLAKAMKGLLDENLQGTIDTTLEKCFYGINQREGFFRIQRSENQLVLVPGNVDDQIQFGILTLWLFASRYCFEMTGECPRKDRGMKKPVAKEPNDAVWYSFALLALELGFDSDQIREL